MPYCPDCGNEIKTEGDYCPSCGARLPHRTGYESREGGSFEKRVDDFAREFEDWGRRTGRAVEKEFGRFGEDLESGERRSDDLFGLLTPLLYSLVTLLVLIFTIGVFRALGAEVFVFDELAAFLVDNLWWIFVLVLFFAYTSYLSKRFPGEARWITPATVAVGITAMLWIAARVMEIISVDQNIPFIEAFSDWIIVFLVPIFIIVLVIGYLGLTISSGLWQNRSDEIVLRFLPD